MGWLKVADNALATFTPVAPLAGAVAVTMGTGATAVVNDHT
jgi:hypothetical protein